MQQTRAGASEGLDGEKEKALLPGEEELDAVGLITPAVTEA
ncbi:hypothetical protein OG453_38335 [Streptomyces sp. NBC_01381]|nr:hypothetical protein [Streptomyces sp. NBC_01381]MCX4672448.1 hypothetical protein [Streptomyces sp. NBC_01381]